MHSTYNTESEPWCELWAWDDDSVSLQARQLQQKDHRGGADADNGGGCACVGAGVVGNLYFLLNVAVTLKLP